MAEQADAEVMAVQQEIEKMKDKTWAYQQEILKLQDERLKMLKEIQSFQQVTKEGGGTSRGENERKGELEK